MKSSHISKACNNCRKAKGRCDGLHPCTPCRQRLLNCLYHFKDRRTKSDRVSKETVADLEVRRLLLDHVWQTIRHNKSDKLLSSIRDGMSIFEAARSLLGEETAAFIKDSEDSHEMQKNLENINSESWIASGAVRSFGNLAMSNAVRVNGYPIEIQTQQLQVLSAPIETCLPLNFELTMDGMARAAGNAVITFRDAARDAIARGAPAARVLSLDGLDLDLFSRERRPDDMLTVANWAAEWGKAWKMFPVEVRYAAIHYIGSLMRWLILPCNETYRAMSPLVRPLPCQLMIPHTVDIDVWGAPPVMREMQLQYGSGWLNIVTSDMQRLHWPDGIDECVERQTVPCSADASGAFADEQGGYFRKVERLSPKFIGFIDKEDAWSVHRKLAQELPMLRDRVQFHDSV